MGWFGGRRRAAAAAAGPATLTVRRPAAPALSVAVAGLPWVAFLQLGDGFFGNEAGWWLLPHGDLAVAIDVVCPGVEEAVRGVLQPALDHADRIEVMSLADLPPGLRRASDGVALLDGAAMTALRREVGPAIRPVRSVLEVPVIG